MFGGDIKKNGYIEKKSEFTLLQLSPIFQKSLGIFKTSLHLFKPET
jgi:hypothetical protein